MFSPNSVWECLSHTVSPANENYIYIFVNLKGKSLYFVLSCSLIINEVRHFLWYLLAIYISFYWRTCSCLSYYIWLCPCVLGEGTLGLRSSSAPSGLCSGKRAPLNIWPNAPRGIAVACSYFSLKLKNWNADIFMIDLWELFTHLQLLILVSKFWLSCP